MLDVLHFDPGDHVLTTLHIQIGICENAAGVAFVKDDEIPFREVLGNTGGEGGVHHTTASAHFCFTEFFRGRHEVGIGFLGGSKSLSLIGDSGFGFGLIFFQFFHLGDELLDVASVFDLFFHCSDLLLDLFEVAFDDAVGNFLFLDLDTQFHRFFFLSGEVLLHGLKSGFFGDECFIPLLLGVLGCLQIGLRVGFAITF